MLGPLLFLIYISDVWHNLQSDVKLFVDNASLFTLVENGILSAQQFDAEETEEIRAFMDRKTSTIVYQTMITPLLTYCSLSLYVATPQYVK